MNTIKVFTDGASRGNPGLSGIGIVVYDSEGNKLKSWNEYTGTLTNNQAEYKALIVSAVVIKDLLSEQKIDFIEFYSDSQLMVRQMNLEYKVKDSGIKPLFEKAQKEIRALNLPYKISHVERALNKEADKLANQGIDNKNAKF